MKNFGIGLVVCLALGCNKAEPLGAAAAGTVPAAQAPEAVASGATQSEAAPSAAETPLAAAAAATAAPAAVTPAAPPASFKGGLKENIAGAVGLGCEATSLDGWLQLLCRKKNGTGGHPVKALITAPGAEPVEPRTGQEPGAEPGVAEAPAGDELTPNEHGELTIVVPYAADEKRDVVIEWTDTRYTLHVTGSQATLQWAASGIPHRRACQQLLDENKAVLAAAQKAEGPARLTTSEIARLPRFGVCQPGGLGSWALSLAAATGKGEGAAREHHLEIDVVRIDIDGNRKSHGFGAFDVTPGGLEMPALQVYDYDDDGRNELIVSYDVKGTLNPQQALPPPIWSFTDGGVVAYTKAPEIGGGISVEQLDFDMRPDLATYGSFVARLGADCGLKACPARVVGPKLYYHSLPDGSFTAHDDATKGALKRACPTKPQAVVVESAGAVNAAQTAKNLVCSKAWGADLSALKAELADKRQALCGEAAECPLHTAFQAWLDAPLPFELSAASSAKK